MNSRKMFSTLAGYIILIFPFTAHPTYSKVLFQSDTDTTANRLKRINSSSEVIEDYLNSSVQIMSPQTASMVMYDNLPVMQNSGRLDFSIPLIHFDDPDFEFPISIRYNSEGFKPNYPDNYTGRDWSLECGGIIYREVKGKPDDLTSLSGNYEPTAGFLQTARSGKYTPEGVRSMIDSDTDCASILGVHYQDGRAIAFAESDYSNEFSSDIYHFRFGRHSGKFMIDFDGSVIVSGNDGGKYKVDISDYNIQQQTWRYNSEIRITTDDGYTYTFGGSYGAVEYCAVSWTARESSRIMNNQIVGFYLSKITAPNGRTLQISYLGENIDMRFHQEPGRLLWETEYDFLVDNGYNLFYSFSAGPVCYNSMEWNLIDPFVNGIIEVSPDYIPREINAIQNTLNKIALIDCIIADDKKIKFSYSSKSVSPYSHADATEFGLKCGARLDSVILYSTLSQCQIEKTSMEYINTSADRMILGSIWNSIEGRYNFQYNSASTHAVTRNIDYWGYLQGDDSEDFELLPEISMSYRTDENSRNNIEYLGNERTPSGNEHISSSLLMKITYPTGGTAEIKYESNDYSTIITRNEMSDYLPICNDLGANFIAGGARIKEIVLKDEYGKVSRRTSYRYTKDPDSEESSGILTYLPQYYHIWRTADYYLRYYLLFNSSGFNKQDMTQPHISYSTVIQYDTEYSEFKRDKFAESVSISAIGEDMSCSKIFVVPDSLSNTEKQYLKWECLFISSVDPGTEGHIKITNLNTGEIIYDKSSSEGRISDIFSPAHEFGSGSYKAELNKKGLTYVQVKAYYDGPEIIEYHGASIVTKYTDHKTNPDTYPSEHVFWARQYVQPSSALPIASLDGMYLRNNFLEPEDHSIERGKVLEKIWLSTEGDTVKIESFEYGRYGYDRYGLYASEAPMTSNAVTASLYANIIKEHFYTYRPTRKNTQYYYGNKLSYEQFESWDYDDEGYLRRHDTWAEDNSKRIKTYLYCYDKRPLPGADIYGLPVSETIFVADSQGTLEELARTEYDYSPIGELASVAKYNGNNKEFGIQFSYFDEFGNPTFAETSQGKTFVYIWGYMGKYPVATIENSTVDAVSSVLGVVPSDISRYGEQMIDAIDGLRETLPETRIDTYTYYPLIGIATHKDESGQVETFLYDESNRLEAESKDGYLLNLYEYHLVHGE